MKSQPELLFGKRRCSCRLYRLVSVAWRALVSLALLSMAISRAASYDFDPAKMTARLRGNPDLKWRAEPQFSYSKPNLLYGIITGSPEFQQYDLTNGKITILHKPAGCVKLDSSDRGFDPSVSADDNRFMAVIGPQQDKNYLVYVYDRQKGCRWLNTQTGEIGGQWGPKGITQSNHFLIHDARISKPWQFIAMVGA